MDRVEVRDQYNKNRLLGTMPAFALRGGERYRQYVIAPSMPMSAYPGPITPNMDIEHIALELDWVEFDGGWTQRLCLCTALPLATLMKLDTFRLPGESEAKAYYRHRVTA
jgi:hypothetical protein